MFLYDCFRSSRLSWTLARSVIHHDFATAGICALGITCHWAIPTSLLATVACFLLLIAAKWLTGRRAKRERPEQSHRGLHLTLATSTWSLAFILRRKCAGQRRTLQCLLRIRSVNRPETIEQENPTSPTKGACPGGESRQTLLENQPCRN